MTKKSLITKKLPPGERRAAAIASARAVHSKMPSRAKLDVSIEAGVLELEARHSDPQGEAYLLCAATGSTSDAWVNRVVMDVVKFGRERGAEKLDAGSLNPGLAFMSAIEPGNEVEAALGVQMFAAHQLALEMASRCRHTTDRGALLEYGNLATKMMRTFTQQMEALGKMRRGGEQVVRHVHVYEGGQAIVADQFNRYGHTGNENSADQPYAPFAGHAPAGLSPMLSQDTPGNGVPIPGDQRKEAVPDARRQKPRRTSRKQT